jgi:hypothetical protein
MLKGNLQKLQGSFFLKRKACTRTMGFLVQNMGELNPVSNKKLSHELPMLLGDALGQ